MKAKKYLIYIITGLIIISCFGVNVSAEEEIDPDRLTIICRKEDVILSDMSWKLYYVADVDENRVYTPTGLFANYPVYLNSRKSSLQDAAGKYETYTIIDNIPPLAEGITDENGELVFDDLQMGLYLVVGEPTRVDELAYVPIPTLITLHEDNKIGNLWTYDLTSEPKLMVLGESLAVKASYDVVKEWKNDNEAVRPKSVTAVLYRNGVEFDSQELSEENNWQFTWKDLSVAAQWDINEGSAAPNYTVSYIKSDEKVTMVNTYTNHFNNSATTTGGLSSAPPTITASKVTYEKLPQTGMLLWRVVVLSVVGIVVFVTGWFFYKRGKDEK